jgi:predicted nucleic acid-binding Zn ribbon protein
MSKKERQERDSMILFLIGVAGAFVVMLVLMMIN